MSKITKRPSRKPYQAAPLTGEDIDLRRWCVEQALKWPTEHYSPAGVYSGGGGLGPRQDVDIIGRATKIMNWVSGSK